MLTHFQLVYVYYYYYCSGDRRSGVEQRQILPAVFTVADAHSPFPRRPLHRMNPITQEQYNIYILAYIAYYPFLYVCASARDYHQINVIIFFFFLFDLIR